MNYADQIQRFCEQVYQPGNPYFENRAAVHCGALSGVFPATGRLIGEDFFALAKSYTQHFPAEHWDINFYGDQFPAFIQAQQQGPKPRPWAAFAWLAEFEYLISLCYYANDSVPFALPPAEDGIEMGWQTALEQAHPYLQIAAPFKRLTTLKQEQNKVLAYAE